MRINAIDIISAGPSAKNARPLGDYTLAVNRAAAVVPCHSIVAGDTKTLQWILARDPSLSSRHLWTMENETPIPQAFDVVMRFDCLPGWTELPANHANWSIQGALAAAVHMHADMIHMWGIDAFFRNPDTTADASGYDGPDADRTIERWKRERKDLRLSIAWAQKQGATVVLHQ